MTTAAASRPFAPLDPLDGQDVREDFPIFRRRVHGRDLIYLDTGASAQKPQTVIDAERRFYETEYANIHRGVYYLSQRATEAYEAARGKIARFVNARESREVIFVRGTTEAINLVAQSYGRSKFESGDEVVLTELEHHANIVPWQILRDQMGIVLRVVPMNERGEVAPDDFEAALGPRTRLAAIAHVSNALGTILPVRQMIEKAHAKGVLVLLDGAQSVPHMAVDMQALDCDFFAFSGHKMYGPTGIGVLYGKAELLESMPPYQGGGDMIASVTFAKTEYQGIPARFEAGTPHIAGAIGLGAAADYLTALGLDRVTAHERRLLAYGAEKLSAIPGLRPIGTARDKAGLISFAIDGVHPHDAATILDQQGVCVRGGHHCAQPAMDHFGVAATLRASFGVYNTTADIDALVAAIGEAVRLLGR